MGGDSTDRSEQAWAVVRDTVIVRDELVTAPMAAVTIVASRMTTGSGSCSYRQPGPTEACPVGASLIATATAQRHRRTSRAMRRAAPAPSSAPPSRRRHPRSWRSWAASPDRRIAIRGHRQVRVDDSLEPNRRDSNDRAHQRGERPGQGPRSGIVESATGSNPGATGTTGSSAGTSSLIRMRSQVRFLSALPSRRMSLRCTPVHRMGVIGGRPRVTTSAPPPNCVTSDTRVDGGGAGSMWISYERSWRRGGATSPASSNGACGNQVRRQCRVAGNRGPSRPFRRHGARVHRFCQVCSCLLDAPRLRRRRGRCRT